MSNNWNPNYGGKKTFTKVNRYKMENGDVVFRILPPPQGPLRDAGIWSKYCAVHFGFKNTEGKIRPFESPLVRKNKVVEVPDAALDRLNDLKAKLEEARKSGNGPLMSKLNTLVGLKGVYSVDNNHHMNVIGLDGKIGVLKLRYKAKLALDAEIKKLEAKGVSPISFDDGRFFVFSRSNMGTDTTFNVSVYKEQIDVPGVGKVERDVVHKLTPEILARLETDGVDLNNIAPKVTAEEVAQIVAESDLMTGKSPAIDRILDARWKKNRDAKAASAQTANTPATAPVAVAATPVVAATTPAAAVSATVIPQAQTAPKAAPVVVAVAPTTPVEELSDADFFAQIRVQQ